MYKLQKIIGFLIILVIHFYLLLTPIKQILLFHTAENNNLSQFSEKTLAKNNKKIKMSNDKEIIPPNFFNSVNAITDSKYVEKEAIGYISLPSVNIYLPILKGTTNKNLWYGATTYFGKQTMGKGNYALFGHHVRHNQLLFSPLENVSTKAKIEITDLKNVYTYKIKNKKIVSEKNVDIISDHGKNEITLVTCDKSTPTRNRLIVQGDLIDIKPYKGNKVQDWENYAKERDEKISVTIWYLYLSLLLISLVVVTFIFIKIMNKRDRK